MEHTREEHIEMLKHPERWPHVIFLPLKRGKMSDKGFEGVIFRRSDLKWRVYLLNMIDLPHISRAEFIEYDSPEAVIDAGWEVD